MEIKTLCLGILALGDATGYEIKKMVGEGSFSFFSEASYGSIYPALTKLTDLGLINCRVEKQESRPEKKIYSLTPKGREALEESLTKDPGPDKNRSEFLAALLFAEAVSPGRVTDLLDDRIRSHRDKIAELKAISDPDDSGATAFVIEYGIAVQEAALGFLTSNKHRLA